ncbi:hypothetical protein PMAYCL1PPCAC_32471, partial [Pristionchus mayeri]
TRRALMKAVAALEKRFGVVAKKIRIEQARKAPLMFATSMHSYTQMPVKEILTEGKEAINPGIETLKVLLLKKRKFTLSALSISLLEENDVVD